jgi:hypothetical protein
VAPACAVPNSTTAAAVPETAGVSRSLAAVMDTTSQGKCHRNSWLVSALFFQDAVTLRLLDSNVLGTVQSVPTRLWFLLF